MTKAFALFIFLYFFHFKFLILFLNLHIPSNLHIVLLVPGLGPILSGQWTPLLKDTLKRRTASTHKYYPLNDHPNSPETLLIIRWCFYRKKKRSKFCFLAYDRSIWLFISHKKQDTCNMIFNNLCEEKNVFIVTKSHTSLTKKSLFIV
jgi:hypothetical protein